MPGPLFSVNPMALARDLSILWTNKREITELQSEVFGTLQLIEVGATCVGSIVQTHPRQTPAVKGGEKGYFRFGGSSTITLFQPGMVQFADDLIQQSAKRLETYAKMGDVAGVANR